MSRSTRIMIGLILLGHLAVVAPLATNGFGSELSREKAEVGILPMLSLADLTLAGSVTIVCFLIDRSGHRVGWLLASFGFGAMIAAELAAQRLYLADRLGALGGGAVLLGGGAVGAAALFGWLTLRRRYRLPGSLFAAGVLLSSLDAALGGAPLLGTGVELAGAALLLMSVTVALVQQAGRNGEGA